MSAVPTWIWNADYEDYYYVTYDDAGQIVYNWSKNEHTARRDSPHEERSLVEGTSAEALLSPDPVPPNVRVNPDFIAGTAGLNEQLDPSYMIRYGREAYTFFVPGRVFAMLHSEPAGSQSTFDASNDAYSYVRFGQVVYSSIRRFIVAEVKHGFVYACAVSTYSNRGTLKPGCVASEHAIVYSTGNQPILYEGETGITKCPIEVVPALNDPKSIMKPESRVRFSKKYPIEKNVKVKDCGYVNPGYMGVFLAYYSEY